MNVLYVFHKFCKFVGDEYTTTTTATTTIEGKGKLIQGLDVNLNRVLNKQTSFRWLEMS